MKCLIVISCALAIASAGYPLVHYPQHIPVIDHNGVPVETPEVQHAKAQHLAAHAAASHGLPIHSIVPAIGHYGGGLYGGHYTVPAVIGHDGQPVETHEVQIAKAAHYAAHAEALGRIAHGGHYRKRRELGYGYQHLQHVPVIGHNGVPVDTPEVQAAKAHHLAAHAEAASRSYHGAPVVHAAPVSYDHGYSGPTYHGPIHIPVIGHNGVPVDTPEVQHARAEHLAALSKANHGGSAGAVAYYGSAYSGGHYGLPAISHDGTPLDTPEVQAAKAQHLAAHAQATGHYY